MLVSIYTFSWTKKIESYFSNRLTISNICSRTSRRINRLDQPLLSPETLSSLSKSRIFLFNAHLALFLRMMTYLQSLNCICKYHHLVNCPWNLPWSSKITIPSPLAVQNDKQNHWRTGEECECEKFRLRRSSRLVCGKCAL